MRLKEIKKEDNSHAFLSNLTARLARRASTSVTFEPATPTASILFEPLGC